MLQLGREIALSSVRRPFRRDSWTIVKPFREILATKGRAKGEDPWHFDASFFFVLFDVESPISKFGVSRDFARIIPRKPSSSIDFTNFSFVETRVKKSFDSIFENGDII